MIHCLNPWSTGKITMTFPKTGVSRQKPLKRTFQWSRFHHQSNLWHLWPWNMRIKPAGLGTFWTKHAVICHVFGKLSLRCSWVQTPWYFWIWPRFKSCSQNTGFFPMSGWLVVDKTPLENMSSSIGMMKFPIPSGNDEQSYGTSPYLMGKSTKHGRVQ